MNGRSQHVLMRLLSFLILLLFLPVSPAQGAEPLKVLTAFPSGETSRITQFTVTFSQPMVPLGDMKVDPASPPVTVTPAMDGQYRWLNPYTLAFEPKTPLEGSLAGQFSVSGAITSLNGAKLGQDFTSSFSLPLISVIQANPADQSSGLPLKPEFRLKFNQPVDLASLAATAFFQTKEGQRLPIQVKEETEANEERRPGDPWTTTLQPLQDLQPDSEYTLVIPAGLKSSVGPIPSGQAYRVVFRTYGPFQVKEITGNQSKGNGPFDPESGLVVEFTNPVLLENARQSIELNPKYDFGDEEEWDTEEYSNSVWIPGPFNPSSLYTIKINSELTDQFGQKLQGQTSFQVRIGSAQPILDLPGRQGVIETTDDPTYPFQVRNIKEVAYRGRFLSPDEAVPFIMSHKLFRYLYESETDVLDDTPQQKIKSGRIKIGVLENRATYQPMRLNDILAEGEKSGLIYFDLQAAETNDSKSHKPIYRRALVQVTNIGLTAKFGMSNTLIWTTDLKTGRPLPQVDLELRNTDNQVLWRGQSDENGLCLGPGAETLQLNRDREDYDEPMLFVLASHEGQFSLVSTEWNQGIQPWNFGLNSQELYEGPEAKAWVMTALPLYKPGDTVHYKIIYREVAPDGLRSPEESEIKVAVMDSRGKIIDQRPLKLSKFGSGSESLDLSAQAPLGRYTIQVTDRQGRIHYSGSFQVEAYRKPTFFVEVQPNQKQALAGERLSASISAKYHFGSPVANQPVFYQVTASQTGYSIPKFEDYGILDLLSDPENDEEPVTTVSQGKANLDSAGELKIEFTATPAEKPLPREFEIEATVTDVDQRTVSQRETLLVHPASLYIGMKSDQYLVNTGEALTYQIIVAKPEGQVVEGLSVDLTLYRRTWNTVRRKGVGGYYHYISAPEDKEIEKRSVVSGHEPVEEKFVVDNSGYYFVVAASADPEGRRVKSSFDFYAYGAGPAGWEHYDHDRIDLIPDKKVYKPGETATILIKSPFTQGTGLVTVEREGIRSQRLFDITGPSPYVQIPITKEDSPNVFVSVVLVRGRISEEIDRYGRDPGKPAFRVGYVELPIEDNSAKLQVTVSSDRPEARPGQEIELNVHVADAAGSPKVSEVALVVVDAALLQLSTDRGYFPENYFFAPHALAVWTTDSRLNLIGRRHYGLKGALPGGGGGMEEGGVRKRFVSLAFYEPHLLTDASGAAKIHFTLPDNLTTFKIYAVAADERNQFGTGTSSILVTKPLLLTSSLPNVAGVGDEFKASVVLHNRSDIGGQATVSLKGESFTLTDSATRRIDIGPQSSIEVGFPVRILPGGTALFRYQASLEGESDAAEFQVPIRFPNPVITSAEYGRLTESATKHIKLPDGADRMRSSLALNLSPSLVGQFGGPLDYLARYPHQCLEQKVSRAWGDLARLIWRDRLGETPAALEGSKKQVETVLNGLEAFQNYEGGFSYWSNGSEPDPYLTAYVIQFLLQAQTVGFDSDQNVLKRALASISKNVKENKWPHFYSPQYIRTTRSYIIDVLADAGQPVAGLLENIYADRARASTFELALLLHTLGNVGQPSQKGAQIKDVTDRIFNRAEMTSGEIHFEEPNHGNGLMASSARTNAFVLRGLIQSQPNNPHLLSLARWLTKTPVEGHWGSTQANAMVLFALTDFAKKMEASPPNASVEAILKEQILASATFKSFVDAVMEKTISAGALVPGETIPLEMKYQGDGGIYYTIRLNYALENPDLTSYQAGMSLSRSYALLEPTNAAPRSTEGFQRGDIIKVDINILVPHERHWVVVEDVLPAGLEPINFDLPVAPNYLKAILYSQSKPEEYYRRYWYDHREIRSDRIMVYARRLTEGVYTLTYLARAVTPGVFITPGPNAEEMYSPEVSGRGSGVRFEIHQTH